jgi:hypothetical protein
MEKGSGVRRWNMCSVICDAGSGGGNDKSTRWKNSRHGVLWRPYSVRASVAVVGVTQKSLNSSLSGEVARHTLEGLGVVIPEPHPQIAPYKAAQRTAWV